MHRKARKNCREIPRRSDKAWKYHKYIFGRDSWNQEVIETEVKEGEALSEFFFGGGKKS